MTATIRPATEAELPAVGALIALSFDDLDAEPFAGPGRGRPACG